MASDPTITGVTSPEFAYEGESVTPFAGVTITDPAPGAVDTVYIGVYPAGSPALQDGAGYNGLTYQPFEAGAAHIGVFYMLQGTASQVTSELDALVLAPSSPDYASQVGISFGVSSSSGASSAENGIEVDYSSAKPNSQGIIDVTSPNQTIYLAPFNVALNHHQSDTTFVFSPSNELDAIHGFKLGSANHDTLSLSGADFNNSIADVLRHTGDVNGSAFITDPKTGDAIRLAGVTTAELKAHPKDFAFYG